MAATTIRLTPRLLEMVKDKCALYTSKAVHPGFVVSLAIQDWADDLWAPGPDVEGPKSESLFLQLDDSAYIAMLRKRRRTNAHSSPIMRRALQDWVDGRWEIGLVRNYEPR